MFRDMLKMNKLNFLQSYNSIKFMEDITEFIWLDLIISKVLIELVVL